MSGILKPMTHTTNTLTPSDAIGIDHIVSVSTVDAVFVGAGGTSEYHLVFLVNAAGNQTASEVVWRYIDASTRDADLATLLTNNSVAL